MGSKPFSPDVTPNPANAGGCLVAAALTWVVIVLNVIAWVGGGWLWGVTFTTCTLTALGILAYLAERSERRNRRR